MAEPRIAPKDDPRIDPPAKDPPVGEPPGEGEPPREAPPAKPPDQPSEAPPPEDPPDKPKPVERIQTLRFGARAIWWSAVTLVLAFGGLALWMGVGRRDPFALFFVILAGLCAVAGYGALSAVRQR